MEFSKSKISTKKPIFQQLYLFTYYFYEKKKNRNLKMQKVKNWKIELCKNIQVGILLSVMHGIRTCWVEKIQKINKRPGTSIRYLRVSTGVTPYSVAGTSRVGKWKLLITSVEKKSQVREAHEWFFFNTSD